MLQYKKIAILLLSLSFFACSESKDRGVRSVNGDVGGDDNIVTIQPVEGTYYSGAILDGASDAQLERKVREFLTTQSLEGLSEAEIEQALNEVDMGSISNTKNDATKGVKVELIFESGSFQNIAELDSQLMGLNIYIYDSLVEQEGYEPIVISFNPNEATYIDQSIEEQGGSFSIIFEDFYGVVVISGSIVGDRFVGELEFYNSDNNFEGKLVDLDFKI